MNENEQPWVDGLTIGHVLAVTAAQRTKDDALVFPQLNLRWSWAEFKRQVDLASRGLLALGIERSEHVAVWATNVPEWIVLQFATAQIGAVLVTINPAYRAHELQYVLAQSDAVALFLVDRFKSSDYHAMLNEVCPELAAAKVSGTMVSGTLAKVPDTLDAEPVGQLHSPRFPKLRSVVSLKGPPLAGALSWLEMLDRGAAVAQHALVAIGSKLNCTEPINVQYTSGTTGFPKAATLSHRNLLLNAFYIGMCQNFTADDRLCIPVPFYHCFGCVLGTLCSAIYGLAMIIPAESFNPTDTLAAMERERATAVYGVPTMFIAMLQDPSFAQRDLKSLRTGIMSGSPCPIEVMRQVIDRMGARQMTIAYGQTEASPVVTQTRAEDPIELRVETVGRPQPGMEVKLVDPASGTTLADNQPGEFCSRGHHVMLGYYNDPAATAAAIDAEGWLHSGDIAVRLPNGYFKITGRIKDMVIRGGENIYPREIEEFLFTHPCVEQASVVGVPDAKFGEELCAWVKLKPGATATSDEIRAYCRSQLAHYKVPRYVKFVEYFPQTVTGKIQKYRIREIMRDELGLKEQETA